MSELPDLPATVRVGYRDWRIACDGSDYNRGGMTGLCDTDAGVIALDGDQRQGMDEIAAVLVHELLHACWYTGGLEKIRNLDEEATVTILANQLTQVWRDNPALVRWLDDALGGNS